MASRRAWSESGIGACSKSVIHCPNSVAWWEHHLCQEVRGSLVYERGNSPDPGSWREILLIIRIVFEVLIPPLFFIIVSLGLVVAFFILLLNGSIFAVIPMGLFALEIIWIARKGSSAQLESRDGLTNYYDD